MHIGSESQEEEYEVEKILKKRVSKDEQHIYYLVHWKGYKEEEATWEPLENLNNALDFVQSYERKLWNQHKNQQKQNEQSSSKQQQARKIEAHKFINKERKKVKKQRLKHHNKIQQCTHEQLKSLNFEIIGAKKPQVIFYVKLSNGRIKSITNGELMKVQPQKIMNFYEKHIIKIKRADKDVGKQQKNDS